FNIEVSCRIVAWSAQNLAVVAEDHSDINNVNHSGISHIRISSEENVAWSTLELTVQIAPNAKGAMGMRSTNLKLGLDPKLIKTLKVFEKIICPLVLLTTTTNIMPVRVFTVVSSVRFPVIVAVK